MATTFNFNENDVVCPTSAAYLIWHALEAYKQYKKHKEWAGIISQNKMPKGKKPEKGSDYALRIIHKGYEQSEHAEEYFAYMRKKHGKKLEAKFTKAVAQLSKLGRDNKATAHEMFAEAFEYLMRALFAEISESREKLNISEEILVWVGKNAKLDTYGRQEFLQRMGIHKI